jgi:hypothetical protein
MKGFNWNEISSYILKQSYEYPISFLSVSALPTSFPHHPLIKIVFYCRIFYSHSSCYEGFSLLGYNIM